MSEEDSQLLCSICHENLIENDQNTTTSCNHVYHSICLNRWLSQGNNTCPICREIIQNIETDYDPAIPDEDYGFAFEEYYCVCGPLRCFRNEHQRASIRKLLFLLSVLFGTSILLYISPDSWLDISFMAIILAWVLFNFAMYLLFVSNRSCINCCVHRLNDPVLPI